MFDRKYLVFVGGISIIKGRRASYLSCNCCFFEIATLLIFNTFKFFYWVCLSRILLERKSPAEIAGDF